MKPSSPLVAHLGRPGGLRLKVRHGGRVYRGLPLVCAGEGHERVRHYKVEGTKPMRLDEMLGATSIHTSRTKARRAIEAGLVTVTTLATVGAQAVKSRTPKASAKVRQGDVVSWRELLPEEALQDDEVQVVYFDDDFIVFNKPAGMAVHQTKRTSANHLLGFISRHADQYGSSSYVVHRIDNDTSGLVIVARTPEGREGMHAAFNRGGRSPSDLVDGAAAGGGAGAGAGAEAGADAAVEAGAAAGGGVSTAVPLQDMGTSTKSVDKVYRAIVEDPNRVWGGGMGHSALGPRAWRDLAHYFDGGDAAGEGGVVDGGDGVSVDEGAEWVLLDRPLLNPDENCNVQVAKPGDANAKLARTWIKVVGRHDGPAGPDSLADLMIRLDTGRTHQIRAHLAAEGTPVAGDRRYSRGEDFFYRLSQSKGGDATESLLAELPFASMALHAWRLCFTHTRTGARVCAEAPLPSQWARVRAAGAPPPAPARPADPQVSSKGGKKGPGAGARRRRAESLKH